MDNDGNIKDAKKIAGYITDYQDICIRKESIMMVLDSDISEFARDPRETDKRDKDIARYLEFM
jgi:hypothetical protein